MSLEQLYVTLAVMCVQGLHLHEVVHDHTPFQLLGGGMHVHNVHIVCAEHACLRIMFRAVA